MSQDTPASRRPPGRIVVVGMGCRLPGDTDSPAALWHLLTKGRDAVTELPAERAELWPADRPTDTTRSGTTRSGTTRSGTGVPAHGGYLRDVSGFDADFFGVSGREADVLDPQHRLLLEVAWEALEHAGMPPDRLTGTSTGVFTGLSYNDYMDRLDRHPRELEGSALSNAHCVAAGRISYLLGLHGPCVALDTACSSSLVAVHLAAQALRTGECDLALAGGVTLMFEPRITRSFDRMGLLSHTGHCHAFDAAADGFVRGEGCGIVVLKRLTDALRNQDRILAVLRGSAVNQDGREADALIAAEAGFSVLDIVRTGEPVTGTRVTVVLGDIGRLGTADRLVAAATADDRAPLRGVVRCAMVLDDAAVANIREDQLRRVWTPKATGAWRLHQATEGHPLDWFAVFSSMASLLGNPGQGAYAAANAWLDGFAAWRSARGAPTLAVNWGPWGETGVATGFADRGYRTIPTDQGLRALNTLLAHRRVHTGVIPGEPDTWIPATGRHSSLFDQLTPGDEDTTAATREGTDDIRAQLSALPTGLARRAALETYLSDHIRAVLRLSSTTLDPQTPLKSLGFDSLLAMELRVRLEAGLNIKLAGNFVWQHPTVAALAVGLAQHMGVNLDLSAHQGNRLGAPG
ncbi:beta-ketoacyl synthase N-terminal-like domain-containing protein [Streptomyces sp. NPDC005336]|uniref:beta-ketoacyl synthase N-terminal-like domain-containing protein n=1 Tax=Streptomyces sp. NPDC005336 TaxID=3157035 RepID=UPI0033BF79E1